MAIDDNTSYELTGYQVKDLAQKIRAKADASSLASVATSGLYSDLIGTPTIPTVYNGKLTIQQNGTEIGTFTANQSADATINLVDTGSTYTAGNGINIDANDEISIDTSVVAELSDLPTKTSDLANDGSDGTSTYVEADDLSTTLGNYQEKLTAGTNISIDANTNTISAVDTTYSAFTGATSSVAGTSGLVPAPAAGDDTKYLSGDGLWKTISVYSLPIASSSTLGGIKIGNNLSIDSSTGVLDAVVPTVNDATLTIQKNGTDIDTFTANASSNKTINITVPTSAADVSALPASTKYGATFELSINSTTYVVTATLKDQDGNTLGTAQTIDLPLESVVVSGSYDSQTKEVVLTLQSGSTIRFSVADLVSGLQTEITSSNKLSADLVDDSTTTNKFVTASDKTTWNGKQDALTAGTNIQINGTTISATDTTYSAFAGATSSVAGSTGLVPAPTTSDPDKFLKGDGTWGTPTDTTYSAGTNVQISAGNVISATDTTYSNFTGATSSVAGTNGLVPAPAAGDESKALHGDGTWKDTTAKLVEMSYGEANSWAKFIAAYNAGSIVYCRASSNANPATGSQTRKAFMAYVNNATSPTNVEFQYVRSQSSKTDSQQCDQVFVYKLTNASGGTWTVESRNMAPKINVDGPITKTFTTGANATLTIGASAMTGATSSAAGAAGFVPAPAAGDQDKVLSGAGTWVTQSGGGSTYTAGSHIDITNDVISAEGYIWGDDAAPASTPASTITSAMIVDGTIQATDIATGVVPTITMTDTDPGEGSPLAANNFIAVYGDDPSNMNYSLTEAKTGATWIDGSPIYKKTIDLGNMPDSTSKQVAHNIQNILQIIKLESIMIDGSGSGWTIPYVSVRSVSVEGNNVVVSTAGDLSSFTGYVTIYYTKSS